MTRVFYTYIIYLDKTNFDVTNFRHTELFSRCLEIRYISGSQPVVRGKLVGGT